jgi:ketosteroid isomerase-like protein
VRDALNALDQAFERRDLEAALALCTHDVVFIGSGDGEVASGRAAIGPMFAALAPHLERLQFSLGAWESVEIDVLGDVAVLFAFAPAELETPNRKVTFRYRLTGVLVRHEGRWLWRVHHGSEPGAW